jgi:hypothetical protein
LSGYTISDLFRSVNCTLFEISSLWAVWYWQTSGIHRRNGPDDRGYTYLWNVGVIQRDYMALHPRRL